MKTNCLFGGLVLRVLPLILSALFIAGCGGDGGSSDIPIDNTLRAKDQGVVTDVDVALAITLSGSGGEGAPLIFTVTSNPKNGVLSGTTPDLVYTPNPLFEGSDNFTFTASDTITTSTPARVHIQVVEGVIHVATTGNDVDPGDAANPKLTIQAGITQADTDYTSSVVKVAAGTYAFDSNIAGPGDNAILLIEGVSIFGGYSATNWNVRDPSVQVTVIDDTNTDDTDSTLPSNVNRTIHAATGITTATIVDGFSIQGGGGDFTTALFLQSGSPTIRNNIILGGTNSTTIKGLETSSGLLLSSSAAAITDNVIDGGSGGHNSRGIDNVASAPTILRNTINGGDAFSNALGIFNQSGSSPLIANNTILSGVGSRGFGVGLSLSSDATIINNTIYAKSFGIDMFSSNPDIRNNIIYSNGTCIEEENNLANPAMMRNNNLFGCSVLYHDNGTTNITDLSTNITTNEGIDTLANFHNDSVDPVFVDIDGADNDLESFMDNDWHLVDSSPTSVTVGGLDLSAIITIDKDNVPRTDDGVGTGWSMGAYEK